MKEAFITAGSVAALLGFAALYGHNGSHRARRAIQIDNVEMIDEVSTIDTFDDWDNMTEGNWIQMQLDLGIPQEKVLKMELAEDVQGKASLNRFRAKDVIGLHDQMVDAHAARMGGALSNFVNDAGIQRGRDDPAAADVDHYAGLARTHPKMEAFLSEFNYREDGTNLFRTGKAQVWFLFPAAVPLFTAKSGHLGKYKEYWNMLMTFKNALPKSGVQIKLSIGIWARGAVFSPRGATYNSRFPWGRIARYYARPRMTTAQPFIIPTIQSVMQWTGRFGTSSASAGSNCYVMWFHQDFAADAANLLIPDQFQKLRELNEACTVLHTFVGVDEYDANVARYAAMLLPGLQTHTMKDEDFSGVFYAKTMSDLNAGAYLRSVFKYMTIVENRAGCRCADEAYVPPATEPSITLLAPTEGPTGAGSVESTDGPGADYDEGTEPAVLEATGQQTADEGTGAPTMRGLLDDAPGSAPKVPEIDSCCGHDSFTGTPYDSELRTCCENGQARAWNSDGMDPCMTFGF